MGDAFDPFGGKPRKASKEDSNKEKLVSLLASYLKDKAGIFAKSDNPENRAMMADDFQDWLDDEMDKALDVEDWDSDQLARLTALFFLALTTTEE